MVARATGSLLWLWPQEIRFDQAFDYRADDAVGETCVVGQHSDSQLISHVGRQGGSGRHYLDQVAIAKHRR